MVVMEQLSPEWKMLCDLSREQQQGLLDRVKGALDLAHKVDVNSSNSGGSGIGGGGIGGGIGGGSGSGGGGGSGGSGIGGVSVYAVHGDMRGPNIMVHVKTGSVKFVDLDWAGIEGVGRYPSRMAQGICWHHDAAPGQAMAQRHDTFLLEHDG